MSRRAYFHFYPREFFADTGHLTNEQIGMYLRLLSHQFCTAKALPMDMQMLMQICQCASAFDMHWEVLEPFFILTDEGYINGRMDHELSKLFDISNKRSNAAKKRWDAKAYANGNAKDMLPKTKDQRPNNNSLPKGSESPPSAKKDCPHQKVVDMYNSIVAEPHAAPVATKNWTPARQQLLRARWREHDDMAFWQQLFTEITQSDFLMGKVGERPFRLELSWILKQENFSKILEGKYHG